MFRHHCLYAIVATPAIAGGVRNLGRTLLLVDAVTQLYSSACDDETLPTTGISLQSEHNAHRAPTNFERAVAIQKVSVKLQHVKAHLNNFNASLEMDEFDQNLAALRPRLDRLVVEAKFILDTAISQASIKIHSTTDRIKTAQSIQDKAFRKNIVDPLSHLDDLVGLRVVCLFRSDITPLGELIRKQFEVVSEDNKLDGVPIEAFGYQSVHFICKLQSSTAGPRYDGLHGLRFEIQVRTLAMDAWASLSHYLDYKSVSDVPMELRKDFFALSGLFYVADTHFEMFYAARQGSKLEAQKSVTAVAYQELELNLDTLNAYLEKRYPDRGRGTLTDISELIDQLYSAGYTTLDKLQSALDASKDAFAKYEPNNRPTGGRFFDVGVVRMSLSILDPSYAELMKFADQSKLAAYRHYLHPFNPPKGR